jgi:hypothetical protein
MSQESRKRQLYFSLPNSFHQQTEFKFKKETSKALQFGTQLCVVLKPGHFGK